MKKLTALFLSLAMILGLAACNSGTPSSIPSVPSEVPAENETPSSQPENSEGTEGENGSTLVVYFSATGNTEQAADYIADITGGDLFQLEPTDPYTDDDLNWTVDGSRVNQEHDDESLRDIELVADTVDNWDSYDTVFIGYPIWWGIAAWPVDGFVEANDFTGKTVIPFCTHNGSRFSGTIGTIEELEPDATVIHDGFTVSEWDVLEAGADVDTWLSELGY